MAYFRTCPKCGATLDPGEQCDCDEEFIANIITPVISKLRRIILREGNAEERLKPSYIAQLIQEETVKQQAEMLFCGQKNKTCTT